ncbi:response regulator [Afifella sp. IM 167]|uniref:response regulator n=1 Tax=Afifella sp. IM 167 TaxID=2033586 RepID=UPI001CD01FE2|nr:response regulator [Afifella sp. IM 167]MBZ8131765.1 response regulator [Afifella sp. IM 167]
MSETDQPTRARFEAEEGAGDGKLAPRLLIVDDDPDILEELGEGLDALGLPSLRAGTGREALDIVQRHPELQVMVTDLQMPQIDGIELLQKLAARRRKTPLSAIVVTGNASLDRAVAALRLNAVDFLQKPVLPEEVAAAVKRAFALVEDAGRVDTAAASQPDYLKALVAARVDREAIFKADLFSDPAWEMLLDLAVAEASGRWVSVTSLCLASGVSTTTALRRIDDLQEAGLVERFPDEADRRRIIVRLTEAGRTRMKAFVERQAARIGLSLD